LVAYSNEHFNNFDIDFDCTPIFGSSTIKS